MKKTLITLITLLFAIGINAQTFEWVKSFGGSSWDQSSSVTVDASGNVYNTGIFHGKVDFDPGAGTAILTSKGNSDIFVQKLDASGNFIWAKSFGSNSRDEGYSLTVDASGNVYTTGIFQSTVDFDPGAGTAILTSKGNIDIFVQKLDASGNFIWAKSFGGNSRDEGYSLTVDASGNVYTTGIFQSTVDFDPGAGTAILTSKGSNDIFVQKLDASGNFIWAKSFGGSSFDYSFSITVDASGNVYTTGEFEETVDFDPGAGTANLTSVGSVDVFVQKLDASGNYIWAKSFGGNSLDFSYSITVDASGNVYTTGIFQSTVDFDPGAGTTNLTSAGSWDIFVQKLDASGNLIWARSFGGSSADGVSSNTSDASGNVYTTGYFRGTVDFDPGVGTANLASTGNTDVFMQKLDAFGNFIWAKSFGSNSDDYGSSITVDASGNVYTTGFFGGTVDFDSGTGTANLTSVGSVDVFVQKMSQGVTGFVDIVKGVQIKAFPNPNKGLVQLTFEEELNNVEITLTDLQGKVIYSKHLKAAKDEQIQIDSATGIYFLSVKTPKGQAVMKLIKE